MISKLESYLDSEGINGKQFLRLTHMSRQRAYYLKNNGIEPKWIQVGNETRNGFLWSVKSNKFGWPELDENGCTNLLIAIVQSWAEDYEKTLSSRDDNKAERLTYLRTEADNLVRDTTVKRIERTHKEFVQTAHDKLFEIVEDSAKALKRTDGRGYDHNDFDGKHMRNRCPLCGGGMYAKRMKSDIYLVRCSRCYLSEIVKVGS